MGRPISHILRRAGLTLGMGWKALATPVALGVHAIVQDAEGRVLLARHSYMRGWHLPGGGVEAGEPPSEAIVRELREELGLASCDVPEFLGLYTRKFGWVSNVIALYRVTGAVLDFKPNLEIREIVWVSPALPPTDTAPGVRRRLAEISGQAERSLYW